MEAAKNAVKDFMSKAGHHDTTVHEKVAPAVQHETVTRQQHENVTAAVDREVHQDHHHTTVQPVHDKETLKETHHHNMVPVEHRKFEHGNSADTEARVAQEAAKFKDQSTRVEGAHTSTAAPIVSGEHVHHHVHETIQPVVQKQTIEPHVVHTTVPVHEVHHNAAKHHATSTLPAVSADEFKKQGGSLLGREERHDAFAGEPRHVGTNAAAQVNQHVPTTAGSGNTATSGTTGSGPQIANSKDTPPTVI